MGKVTAIKNKLKLRNSTKANLLPTLQHKTPAEKTWRQGMTYTTSSDLIVKPAIVNYLKEIVCSVEVL